MIDTKLDAKTDSRTASCACGSLKLTVAGKPAGVYACGCLECQRATGTAFAWRARFAKAALRSVDGERRTWRRSSDAGRWIEQVFCPTCGTLLYMEAEAIPDDFVVSAGCFGDPAFPPPASFFWARRRHDWYGLAEGVAPVE